MRRELTLLHPPAQPMYALVHIGHELVENETRRLRTIGEAAKNRSISMVLPRPTSAKM